MKRQKFNPSAVVWNAMIAADRVYQSNANVNTERRPNLSAIAPKNSVPTSSPVNAAAMKLAMPLMLRKRVVVAVRTPDRMMPGAM